MSDIVELKKIFSNNLKRHLYLNCKLQAHLAKDLKIPETTVSNWIQGNAYPRVDKIQMMADYFNIARSDLTELPMNETQKAVTIREQEIVAREKALAQKELELNQKEQELLLKEASLLGS